MLINMLIFFVFGVIMGSIFCKIGFRLPLKKNLFTPSVCNSCEQELKFNEKIPILSFIAQRGRCNYCGQKISMIYPLFEFGTGILYVLTYLAFKDFYNANLTIAFGLAFVSSLLLIMITDIKYMLIPNKLVLLASFVTITLKIVLGIRNEELKSFMDVGYELIIMAIDAIIMFLLMYIVKKLGELIFRKDALGGGDVKMMAFVAAILGYKLSIVIVFFASFIALPISIITAYRKNNAILPFGPYLAAAALFLFLKNISFESLLELIK